MVICGNKNKSRHGDENHFGMCEFIGFMCIHLKAVFGNNSTHYHVTLCL